MRGPGVGSSGRAPEGLVTQTILLGAVGELRSVGHLCMVSHPACLPMLSVWRNLNEGDPFLRLGILSSSALARAVLVAHRLEADSDFLHLPDPLTLISWACEVGLAWPPNSALPPVMTRIHHQNGTAWRATPIPGVAPISLLLCVDEVVPLHFEGDLKWDSYQVCSPHLGQDQDSSP